MCSASSGAALWLPWRVTPRSQPRHKASSCPWLAVTHVCFPLRKPQLRLGRGSEDPWAGVRHVLLGMNHVPAPTVPWAGVLLGRSPGCAWGWGTGGREGGTRVFATMSWVRGFARGVCCSSPALWGGVPAGTGPGRAGSAPCHPPEQLLLHTDLQ